jgi:hypothetical protein
VAGRGTRKTRKTRGTRGGSRSDGFVMTTTMMMMMNLSRAMRRGWTRGWALFGLGGGGGGGGATRKVETLDEGHASARGEVEDEARVFSSRADDDA